jgi:general secretion pathway protein L
MKTLRVRLCPLAELGAEAALEYEVLDSERRVQERGTAVPAALPRLARTELVIAAPDVLLLDAALPRLSGARLRAALPGLAEPSLLGDIEQAFVAAGKPNAAGRATLAVLERGLVRRALDLFARLGIVPASATPEQLELAAGPGRWRLKLAAAYGSLRMGERLGIACSPGDGAEPPVELRLALGQAGGARPEAIEVEGECDAAAWSASLGVPVVAAAADRARAAPAPALELLQYEFAPRIVDWRAWRTPAALAAALAFLWIVGLNIDAWRMLREGRQLRAQMNATFREAFPRVPVVLDPLAQMRRGLADMRSGAGTGDAEDFLPLAASFAQAAQADSDAVRQIEYRDRALEVRFEPRAVDSAQKRDALVQRLTKAGLSARFSESTLRVRKGGGA